MKYRLDPRSATDFECALVTYFDPIVPGAHSAAHVMEDIKAAFARMSLPVPRQHNEFMDGIEGVKVFSSHLGMVLNIGYASFPYVNDSPWVDAPLLFLPAGDTAMIEFRAGGKAVTSKKTDRFLHEMISAEGRNYHDRGARNEKLHPVATPDFPDGVPAVCDRGAVTDRAPGAPPRERTPLEIRTLEALNHHYAPLRDALALAARDPRAAVPALRLCAAFTRAGGLAAGWDDRRAWEYSIDWQAKAKSASICARAYDQRVRNLF